MTTDIMALLRRVVDEYDFERLVTSRAGKRADMELNFVAQVQSGPASSEGVLGDVGSMLAVRQADRLVLLEDVQPRNRAQRGGQGQEVRMWRHEKDEVFSDVGQV